MSAPSYTRAHLWLLAALCVPMAVWLVDLLVGTAPIIAAAALVPALFYAVVIGVLQRGGGRPLLLLCLAFVWGAVGAAYLSSSLNALAREWLDALTGGDDVRTMVTTFVGPGIEEVVKALGLMLFVLLRRSSIRTPRDGIVYGALVGVGFVAAENLLYHGIAAMQGGEAGLARSAYLRGFLGGATHAVFTASFGAGLGWAQQAMDEASPATTAGDARSFPAARTGDRTDSIGDAAGSQARVGQAIVALALGTIAALVQHVAWNAVAADLLIAVICDAETAGGACRDAPTGEALFGWATLVTVAFIGPGAAALTFVARRSRG